MSQTYLNYSGGLLFATMSKSLKKSGQRVDKSFLSYPLNKREGGGIIPPPYMYTKIPSPSFFRTLFFPPGRGKKNQEEELVAAPRYTPLNRPPKKERGLSYPLNKREGGGVKFPPP